MTNISEKPVPASTSTKARYLVAVFSVLVVTIVAVLVVTVASQSRNNIRQQQQTTDDIASDSSTEFRHPRFISRTHAANRTVQTAPESLILESVRALVMRVVTPVSNSTETVSSTSGRFEEIDSVDNEAGSGQSKIISNKKRK